MEGQMSLSDYTFVVKGISWERFHEHCTHRGWLKGPTETEPAMYMCGCANGILAKNWDDWVPCKECNCFIAKET